MLKRIFRVFYISYFLISFLAILFLVLPFYILLALPDNTASRKRIWILTRISCKIWLRLIGMSVQIKGEIPRGKRFIIIANHISYLDPVLLYDTIPFPFRPLAKHEIARVPFFGFIYKQVSILVDRNNAANRAKSLLQMQHYLKNECSIFIYPEGTFNETAAPMKHFYDGAFRLAIDTQTDILPILFPDTPKRWHYSAWWKLWPGQNRAFVLSPIRVAGLGKADCANLKKNIFDIMSAQMSAITA